MPYENANYISQLNQASPDGDVDDVSQGDDELRQLKRVLLNQFPNLGAAAVTATAGEINNVVSTGGALSVGSSTTPLLINTGPQVFTTQAARGFAVGQQIKITSDASVANFMIGTCTAYTPSTGIMSVSVTQVGGSGTFADWSITVFVTASPLLLREARTSNTMLVAADRGKLIEITSGTFSQTFDAVAALGDGWWCYLRNSGTGVVTLDPNDAETIDGVATKALAPAQTVIVQCDGAALRTVAVSGAGNHEVVVHTGNGHGSTNTKIRRFTTAMTNVGTAITYADSATLGASFTINETGLYAIFYADYHGASTVIGASVNSAQLTVGISSITTGNRLFCINQIAGNVVSASRVVRLSAGDVVRAHTEGVNTGADATNVFSIRKVGI